MRGLILHLLQPPAATATAATDTAATDTATTAAAAPSTPTRASPYAYPVAFRLLAMRAATMALQVDLALHHSSAPCTLHHGSAPWLCRWTPSPSPSPQL